MPDAQAAGRSRGALVVKPFSLLIKPTSADCNLRCAYCFYLPKLALYPQVKRHRMSLEVLERMVSSYMATDQPQYIFGWQGGEPTLMGLEFFQHVTRLQVKYGKPGAIVSNGLQTNATLIDDALAAHLAEYNFLVGVSIDGPEDIHDRWRTNAAGVGSHADVLRGIRALQRHGAEFNALVLVNSANVGRAAEVYHYLCDLGILFHQYIPCVEFDEHGRPLPYTITGAQWGDFLCAIFDEWISADTRRVSIRLFDAILALLVDGVRNVCHFGRNCRQYFVVEYNGDVYPCDFFVEPDLKLGNVLTHSWEQLQQSETYRRFGRQKAQWNKACNSCEFLHFCSGDCLKHRFRTNSDPRSLSWLCEGWKRFYSHSLPAFRRLAAEIAAERERELEARRQAARAQAAARGIGRNDPCPCGSGKKFKHCCGA